MNELDFSSRQVLVIGGSYGIGNGIAQAFRARGASVAVCGTRAKPSDYSAGEGSRLDGWIISSSTSVMPEPSRNSIHRSPSSTCWCWRRVR